MDEFVHRSPGRSSRSAWRCSWSCSGSTPSGSGRPSTTRRRATASGRGSAGGWPGTASGFAHRDRDPVHPSRRRSATCSSARATGSQAVLGGIAYGLIGILVAVSFATYRYHRIRFPDAWSYPGRCSTRPPPRSSTRSAFRGALFGLLLLAGVNPTLANFTQAIIYTLTTRLGAPGRDRYLLAADARDGPARRLADGRDRRHRGGVPRPRHHPLRGLPVHRPHRPDQAPRARGRGDREAPPTARGWRVIGSRESRFAGSLIVGAAAPPVALYVHIPFCVSLCPYCDFVVVRRRGGARSAGTGRAFVAALARRAGPARRRARRGVRARSGRRSRRSTSAAGRRRCCRPRRSRALLDRVRARFGHRGRRRGHARGQPRARRARRRGGASRGRRHPAVDRRPGDVRRRAPAAGPAAPGRRRRADRRRGARRPASARSASTCCTTCPDATLADWIDDARRGARPRARPPVALRPDPRRPRRRGADRARRRPPADDRRARAAGGRRARPAQDEDRAAAEYHHAVHRLAEDGWRGYEISNWARPGHESRHNLVYWERRPYEAVGPGRARLRRRRPGAGTRPGSTATSRR